MSDFETESPLAEGASSGTGPGKPTGSSDRLAPGDGLIIGLLMVSTFIVFLNEMLLGVALPRLLVDLDITATTGQWLTTGYLLVLVVLIPATGFVMRKFNLRTIYLTSMALFALGTVMAAVAPSFGLLFAGRIIQAVGTAAFLPLLMATVMRLTPAHRQGQSMAMVVAVTAAAPALGPALSGLILSQLSWRWLFIIIVPLAVAGLILGYFKLKNIGEPEPVKLDVASLVLSAIGFGALVYGLASIGESFSDDALLPPWIPILVGAAGIAAFVVRQTHLQRNDNALLDVQIFAVPRFTIPFLGMFLLTSTALSASVLIYPLVLANIHSLSSLQIGLFLVPGGIAITVMSMIGGRLLPLVGPRPLVIPGALVVAGSLWFMSQADAGTSVLTLLIAYIAMFVGQALMWSPLTTMALSALPAHLYPHGSAAFGAVQQLGGATGSAILISAYTLGSNATSSGLLTVAQSVSGSKAAFTAAGVIATLSVVCAIFVRRAKAADTAPVATEPVAASAVH